MSTSLIVLVHQSFVVCHLLSCLLVYAYGITTRDMSMASPLQGQTYTAILAALLPPLKPYPLLPSFSSSAYDSSLSSSIAALSLHPTLEALLHILNNDLPSAHFLVRHMQSPMPLTASCTTCSPSTITPATDQPNAVPVRTMADVVRSPSLPSTTPAPHPPGPTPQPHHPPAHLTTNSADASVPKAEGLALHALLHRIELDTENARAWYRDLAAVAPALKLAIWPGTAVRSGDAGTEGALPTADVEAFLDRVDAVRGAHANLPPQGSAGARMHIKGDVREVDVAAELVDLERESGREIRALLGWLEARYGTAAWADVSGEWASHGEKIGAMAQKQVVGGEGWRSF